MYVNELPGRGRKYNYTSSDVAYWYREYVTK